MSACSPAELHSAGAITADKMSPAAQDQHKRAMHAKIAIAANTAPKKAERAASANDDP